MATRGRISGQQQQEYVNFSTQSIKAAQVSCFTAVLRTTTTTVLVRVSHGSLMCHVSLPLKYACTRPTVILSGAMASTLVVFLLTTLQVVQRHRPIFPEL